MARFLMLDAEDATGEAGLPEAGGAGLPEVLCQDFLVNQLCYLQMDRMDPTRIKVCRKLKAELRGTYQLGERAAADLALKMERSVHRAFFLQLPTYRRAVVWLVRKIQVLPDSPVQGSRRLRARCLFDQVRLGVQRPQRLAFPATAPQPGSLQTSEQTRASAAGRFSDRQLKYTRETGTWV